MSTIRKQTNIEQGEDCIV